MPFQGNSPCIASAPISVVTLGTPNCIASINLPLIPAPNLRGAKQTLVFFITRSTLSARPLIKNPSFKLFKSNTFFEG